MRKLVLLAVACAVLQAAPVRTLILSGHNNHGWRTTTPYLGKLLKDSGRFDVRLEEEPAGITADTLAGTDLRARHGRVVHNDGRVVPRHAFPAGHDRPRHGL
jgi:hypothetical protein